jgi:hypothetical protein
MCSYNKVNGSLSCENDEVLNKLLKEEVRFSHSSALLSGADYLPPQLNYGGFVVTDCSSFFLPSLSGSLFCRETYLPLLSSHAGFASYDTLGAAVNGSDYIQP